MRTSERKAGRNLVPPPSGGKRRAPRFSPSPGTPGEGRGEGFRALQIIHEDRDLLVVNNPPGLLTSTTPRERRPTLWAMVREYLSQTDPRARPGLIHRLDQDASGLLVFSKNDPAYRSLKSQFYHHSAGRIYSAVVSGIPDPPSGRIESNLIELPDGHVRSTKQHGRGQHALTEYQVISTAHARALLRIKLHTGRKHQIRAHLAELNHPILGDRLYGPANLRAPRLMLAATELSFTHPRTAKPVKFKIDLPPELRDAIRHA